jgi:4-amino-4-deoxy-L-arabinose transferase-like glycosyltransferase
MASFDFGVTWDEKSRHKYGELVWDFLKGTRSRSEFGETGGHLYGGLFDFICVGLEQWLPGNRYVIRHGVNAVFGWVGVVYCGRLAAQLFGRWTGVLAMVLLVITPRYFAHSMNNPKDLPFAALSVMALYYISTISPRWPYLSWKSAAMIVLSLALALNVRVGSLIYVGYLGLLVGAYILAERNADWRRLSKTALHLAALVVAVLLLGTLVWPWAQGAPLWRPFRALVGVADFPYDGGTIFAGRDYAVSQLPWYYVPWWLLISTPPVVLFGVVLAAIVPANRRDVFRRLALAFVVVWPVSLVIVMGSTLYDGVRHLLFIYPVIVALAAAGWMAAVASQTRPWRRIVAGGLLAAGIASILTFDVRFHPNEIVYFNPLVSGPRGAFARYEMDYWGNCVLEAVAWSAKQAKALGVPVTVSGNPFQLVQLDAERFHEVSYVDPARGRHYFHIRLAKGPIAGVTEMAEQPALYQVKTPDGVVLCNVIPGPAYGELQALVQSRHLPAGASNP